MFSRLERKLYEWATRPMPVRRALCLAAVIMVPTLFSGLFLDDCLHLLTLRGEATVAQPYDLFQFAAGNPDALYPFLNRGPLPWYTLPDLKLHFFRPLSSATMVADHTLFGDNAVLYHVQSLLWYVLLVWGVFLLYRRHMAAGLAALCCLLYALDDGHIIPALWWSNRNAIVSAAPAILGLVAHVRWREEHWRPGLPLSLIGYGLGLLGGETALGIFGFLIAYELVYRHGSWFNRVRALTAPGLLAVGYLIIYKLAGYGVHGSGVYLDPISEWRSYLAAAPTRILELAAVQFFSMPVELAVAAPQLQGPLLLTAIVLTITVAAGSYFLWQRSTKPERKLLAWMALGSFIAVFPVLATFPSGRLLILPSIGGCAWIGLFIQKGIEDTGAKLPILLRSLGRLFLLLHVVIMPFLWIGLSAAVPTYMALSEVAFRDVDLDPEKSPDQYVFCIFAPDPYTGFYPLIMRQYFGYPSPRGWQNFSLAPFDHELTRTAINRFEIRVVNGELFSTTFEQLIRSPAYPYAVGDEVPLNACVIEILAVGDTGPTRFAVTLDHPLDDPRYHFLAWQDGRLATVTWPAVGESQIFSAKDGFFTGRNFKKQLPLL